jgi:hypothetical protein
MITYSKRFAIRHPKGNLLLNILEVSEGWAWAVFYMNQVKEYHLPSDVPPDWIKALRESGYRCVEMIENTRAETKEEGECANH